VAVDAENLRQFEADPIKAARIRSSVLFLGALLGKMKRAVLPLPGGCAIGSRPIDLHLAALQSLGARISVQDRIIAQADCLRGTTVHLPFPSVGATENLILACTQAEGRSRIVNAAREPEIDELIEFLVCRGAQIIREADGTIRIDGGRPLGPVCYEIRADRIVTGTYLLAVCAAGGRIRISNAPAESLASLFEILRQMGAEVETNGPALMLSQERRPHPVSFTATAPYPGFPTDLQSPLLAALCRAGGDSVICETIFENRFGIVKELERMGASIRTEGRYAMIRGVKQLHQATVCAPDLRGGAALVIAALQAEGTTRITQTEYIRRGYENLTGDLSRLGAAVRSQESQADEIR
jgi:UDP-N-acetylglucosamine 1-carboxyvinyltransferase